MVHVKEDKKFIQVLEGKVEGKRPLGRPMS